MWAGRRVAWYSVREGHGGLRALRVGEGGSGKILYKRSPSGSSVEAYAEYTGVWGTMSGRYPDPPLPTAPSQLGVHRSCGVACPVH